MSRYTKFIWFALALLLISCSVSRSSAQANRNTPFPDYLTPLMCGAKGDGRHDDTDALRRALYESNKQGKVLYIPSGYNFKVTGTLNYFNNVYQSYTLNLMGCLPIKRGSYSVNEYGGISVSKGVDLFKGAVIKGSIDRVCITGQRDLNVHFFDNCDCQGLVIHGCNISNFGAFFYDSKLHKVGQITHNTFLTVYYFARNDKTSSGMTDSTISFNYINGGMEQNNNSCFEWSYYNGDIISNNFIDYYRTIYYPKATSKQAFVGPLSYSNQYQVFRYFYAAGPNINTVTFSSTADSFNWNDPTTLEKLQKYEAYTYKGKDGKTYEIPPYVACCNAAWNITISDAKVERNMKSLVYVGSTLTEYEDNRFDVSFTGNNKYKEGQINYRQGGDKLFFNGGKFLENKMRVEGVIEVEDKLPSLNNGWSNTVPGRTVKVGNKTYKAVNRAVAGKWKAEWEEQTN